MVQFQLLCEEVENPPGVLSKLVYFGPSRVHFKLQNVFVTQPELHPHLLLLRSYIFVDSFSKYLVYFTVLYLTATFFQFGSLKPVADRGSSAVNTLSPSGSLCSANP